MSFEHRRTHLAMGLESPAFLNMPKFSQTEALVQVPNLVGAATRKSSQKDKDGVFFSGRTANKGTRRGAFSVG
jgi:hypothetical protein